MKPTFSREHGAGRFAAKMAATVKAEDLEVRERYSRRNRTRSSLSRIATQDAAEPSECRHETGR